MSLIKKTSAATAVVAAVIVPVALCGAASAATPPGNSVEIAWGTSNSGGTPGALSVAGDIDGCTGAIGVTSAGVTGTESGGPACLRPNGSAAAAVDWPNGQRSAVGGDWSFTLPGADS
ncbi:hypothetical protein [Nocardia crassostreae]|uniref:hypothetical protein n=1 Tax=Nocardia crassostreae TaxID=53428 RepID=UPI0008329EC7|nr:hypothetical protein [Nocardia crassostreae]